MGCTTIIFRNGKVTIPPDWVLDDRSPEIAREVRRVTQMKDEDALLIGSGSDRHGAINAVVSAAFELI
jgi:hypothetical protein